MMNIAPFVDMCLHWPFRNIIDSLFKVALSFWWMCFFFYEQVDNEKKMHGLLAGNNQTENISVQLTENIIINN